MTGLIIGLTGPTGAGKTTVASELARQGCCIIDCDLLAREAAALPKCFNALQQAFGKDIAAGGVLDRALLAKRAFENKETAEKLNSITHPAIMEEVQRRILSFSEKGAKAIVVDAALLFESGADRLCTVTVAVTAPKEIRLWRIMQRDSITMEQANARVCVQQQNEYYEQLANWQIDGGGSVEHAARQTAQLLAKLMK